MFISPLLPVGTAAKRAQTLAGLLAAGALHGVWSARLAPPTVPGALLFRLTAAAAGAEECPLKQWGINLSGKLIG